MKRSTKAAISEAVSVWDVLVDVLADSGTRPENSVTPEELAAKKPCSHTRAAAILRAKAVAGELRAVYFKTQAGRRGVCYVRNT